MEQSFGFKVSEMVKRIVNTFDAQLYMDHGPKPNFICSKHPMGNFLLRYCQQ